MRASCAASLARDVRGYLLSARKQMMNDRSYAKLFSGIVTSSMWSEDLATRVVWITILASKNEHGEVFATIGALSRIANVPVEQTKAAIDRCLAPDPESRTKANEGRRLEVIDGGWRVLNNELYKNMASSAERKEYQARKYKERKSREVMDSTLVNTCQHLSTDSRQEEEEEEEEEKTTPRRGLTEAVKLGVIPLIQKHPQNTQLLSDTWSDWVSYRMSLKKSKDWLTMFDRQVKFLSAYDAATAAKVMTASMTNGWQGLIEPKNVRPINEPKKLRQEDLI